MSNAISTLNILPQTKAEIKNFTAMVINELESGNFDGLPLAVKLSAMEKTIKDIKETPKYKELIRIEAEKYGANCFDFQNAKIELAEVGTKYDYTVCNDAIYNDLLIQQEQIKEMIKARETMLKTGINPETGEQFQKPIKTSTSSIKITLK